MRSIHVISSLVSTLVVGGCLLDAGGLASLQGSGGAVATTTATVGGGSGDGGAVVGTGGAGGSATSVGPGGAGGTGGQDPLPDLCGDGTLEGTEECDDGNAVAGDGCSPQCTVECIGVDEHLRPGTLHCYRIITGSLRTWDEGRTDCQNLGPGWDLATITDEAERDYVDDTVDPDVGPSFENDDPFQYWLLGRDITMTDNFEWLNGETWGYTPWDDDPQDPSNGGQDCIRLRPKAGGSNDVIRDAVCTLTSSSLCERPPAGSTL